MKAPTMRRFLALHTWVGLIAGMALFIAFYAGAITVFHHEIADWNRIGPSAAAPDDPVMRSQELLDELLKQHPQAAESVYLVLPGEHGPQPSAYWFEASTGASRRFMFKEHEALQEDAFGNDFIEFIYDLHFTAGLPKPFGTYLFGVVCLLYGLALVSGVVVYSPTLVKDLFALRLGKNLKRLWQDAHTTVGMLSLPFHLVIAWSSAVLALGLLLLAPFQYAVYEGQLLRLVEQDFYGAPQVTAAGVTRASLPVAELLRRGQMAMPGMEVEGLSLVNINDVNARVTLYGDMEQRRLSQLGSVTLDAATGKIISTVAPKTMTPGMIMLRGLQALHFGSFGHDMVKWLYFVLALAGAFLFYSGNLLWIETRRKHRQVAQPRRTRVMAVLTLGVCLGCVAGVSAVFVAGALVPGAGPTVYFMVFFMCVLWACLRQPARAGHELLWVCALATAAIPLAGWVGSGENLLAAAHHGHWHRFSVDAVALLMAFVYWRMARATLRRGYQGNPNSVWALH